ncbi:hypothetical protein vBRpoSV10_223 [Ruegeria phage vB_RpoS-V10]|nr:hypothetical protein DSS3P8_218 [Roseobacter phage DSS3P8]AWY09345.1 hypothetical protein vBRpoSV10_223 [Ruegeria phage vB_RpoS-V10]
MSTPTAAEARKALVTLALYFSRTPALNCDPDLVSELPRPFVDVVTDWAVGLGHEPLAPAPYVSRRTQEVRSASVMGLVLPTSSSQFDGPFEQR